ncbi:hypothetical protein HPB50_018641 [Hyalomma asiaticum]|uniref:Uncharacterized protein n=1 Tax=Hyalomma asiaticum TaxID=266040 RepID=A0ACB7T044_HYAAI|nr:hypothetical protein HPB50_018641 [Hyalomma asiaticum]
MAASAFEFTQLKAVMLPLYIVALTDMRTLAFSKGELTLESLQKHLGQDTAQLGPTCRKDVLVYLQHLRNGSEWALKMFDSSGKADSGILKGGHTFIGFYSECLEALPDSSVMQKLHEHSPPPPSFTSMYCRSEVRIAPSNRSDEKAAGESWQTRLFPVSPEVTPLRPAAQRGSEGGPVPRRRWLYRRRLCCNHISEALLFGADTARLFFVVLATVAGAATVYDYTGRRNKKAAQQCVGLEPLHLNNVQGNPDDMNRSGYIKEIVNQGSLAVVTFLFIG